MKSVTTLIGVLVVLAVLVCTALADPYSGRYPCFGGAGLKAGYSSGNMNGEFTTYFNDDFGLTNISLGSFTGGFFVAQSISPAYQFQQEVLLVQRGTKWEESGASVQMKLSYVQVVALGRIVVPTQSSVRPAFFFGPHLGFLTASDFVWNTPRGDQTINMKEYTSDIEVGLDFGAALDLQFSSSGRLTIEGRYSLGLTEAFKAEDGSQPPSDKLNAFSLMAGFAFQ
jgi:hypothetical protein